MTKYNQSFQFVTGLKALHRTAFSPLRCAKAAAEYWRYGSGCRIVSHWVVSVFEKTMERRKYNGLSYDFGLEARF